MSIPNRHAMGAQAHVEWRPRDSGQRHCGNGPVRGALLTVALPQARADAWLSLAIHRSPLLPVLKVLNL